MYSRTVPIANEIPNIWILFLSFILNKQSVNTIADTPYTTLNGPNTSAEWFIRIPLFR